ncbi:hypothetical protein [Pseudoclavibacter sp. CFCC 11306]|uniref:hypothetical protein n=1 Tax=Pseudoclavibacter sp. CFCC 11306 TaxID=1564493 RepID=UPI00130131BF|nr:hypothetical protein [Pseudoclavibacter sp. CFCC 11306]KAB1658992.1 hypothetical protein F8O09_05350 [Pseudoclavibacter sp. CFCC 11306]
MDVSNWINVGLLGVAAISAWVAIWAQRDAVKSKDEAAVQANRALKAAEASATSQERSATALEEQADLMKQAAKKPTWDIRKIAKHRWSATNSSETTVRDVHIRHELDDEGAVTISDAGSDGCIDRVLPGRAFSISFGGRVVDPPSADISVVWNDVDDRAQSQPTTLM